MLAKSKARSGFAHVHHDLHVDLGQRVELNLFALKLQQSLVDIAAVAFRAGYRHFLALADLLVASPQPHHSRNTQLTRISLTRDCWSFERKQIELDSLPKIDVKIMMNVGNPDRAFDFASIPHRGVGLARLEFIINRMIGVHPRALLEFDRLDGELQDQIRTQMAAIPIRWGSISDKLAEEFRRLRRRLRRSRDRAIVRFQVE